MFCTGLRGLGQRSGHGIISAGDGTAGDGANFFLHHSQWREEVEHAKADSVEFTQAVGKDRRPDARDVRKIDGAGAIK